MNGFEGKKPRVLVTGASVAGPTLAWALSQAGFDVVLLERSAEQRSTGQNIDIRGIGRQVIRRMGVEKAVLAQRTGERGTRYVHESGAPYAVFPQVDGEDGPTAEIEILRGALAGILVENVPSSVERRYGDYIERLDQDHFGVSVTFASGAEENFDLVLVAEGRSSRTRRIAFAQETTLKDFGVTITYGTLDRRDDDHDHWDWFTAGRGRVASIRPDNVGTMRASLSFESEPMGFESLSVDAQLTVLRARFAGAGWQSDRILDGFSARTDEFYVQRMEQVIMSRWSKGRVALIGDAAWGSGPTGMGTTLALVGAYLLAGELSKELERGSTPFDPTRAFATYERLMRRYADSAQGLPRGGARLLHPRSGSGVRLFKAAMRVAASKPVRRFAQANLLTSEKHVPRLRTYKAFD